MLLAKMFFSIYNVMSLLLLNFVFEKEFSGNFLFLLSQFMFVATISRLGSDFYWSSGKVEKKIRVVKNEFRIHFAVCLLTTVIFLVVSPNLNHSDFLVCLFIFGSSNFMQLMGRHFQQHKKHITSLFLFTVGPTGISVPFLMIFDSLSVPVIVAMSNFCICVPFIKHFYTNCDFEVEENGFFDRVSFLPMLGFGMLNQHLIALFSGLNSKHGEIAILVVFQRMAGLISWPLVIFMQTNLHSLGTSVGAMKDFISTVKGFMSKFIPLIVILTLVSLTASCTFLYIEDNLSIMAIFSMLLITLGCLLNAIFAYVQYQMGVKRMTLELSLIILVAMLFSYYFYSIVNFSAASSFFIFHVLVHFSSIFCLVRKIKINE